MKTPDLHHAATLLTPIGKLSIQINHCGLSAIRFLSASDTDIVATHPIAIEACEQLQAYFNHSQRSFTVALAIDGTPFQQRVWQALCEIPCGKTLSYGELAKKLSTSPRAIGAACRTNRLPIIIPCHRVVANHHLGGYNGTQSGRMLSIKSWLLQHETVG